MLAAILIQVYTLASASTQSRQILPVIPLHSPIPPPVLGGAALFIPAVKHLKSPYYLPDVACNTLVTFVEVVDNVKPPGRGRIIGVGRVATPSGTTSAWEKWANDTDGLELAGKFCDVLNIVGDRYVSQMIMLTEVYGTWARQMTCR